MLQLEFPAYPMRKYCFFDRFDLNIVIENGAIEMLWPVGMTLDSTPLTYRGQHDDERTLSFPNHEPEIDTG